MYKYELHAHTAECDKFARVSGAEMVKMYRDAGYSGIVITDHYFSLFFEWFKDELDFYDHKKIMDRFLKGYYSARNEGEKTGFSVICGAEVRFDNTVNDYLVYGLEENDFYNLPILNRLRSIDELICVLPENTLVVQAHPFRDNMTVCNPAPIFGIEVYNGGTEKFRNEMAKIYANHYGKAVISGSDFHAKEHLARGGIITEHKICTPNDLTSILQSGDYLIIEGN